MARGRRSEPLRRKTPHALADVDGEANPNAPISRMGVRPIHAADAQGRSNGVPWRGPDGRAIGPLSHCNGDRPRRAVTIATPVELERSGRELGFQRRILDRQVAHVLAVRRRSSARSCAGYRCATSKRRLKRPSTRHRSASRRSRVCHGLARALPALVPAPLKEHDLVY
jgi:hypothetical protein